jgi:hypothetical protein
MRLLSRRDHMMVARYEMPGNTPSKDPSRRVRYDWFERGVLLSCAMSNSRRHGSYRSLRDGSYLRAYQAFHARLPSFGPSGTSRVGHDGHAARKRYSNTPALHYSARQNPMTACPRKPKLYSADRSSRPRKRGALHNQNVGEVGRTRTKHRTPNVKRPAPNAHTS